ncbi:MAG: 50S ribosomal protein L32 [Candidatus Methylacidiphilales bacterium]
MAVPKRKVSKMKQRSRRAANRRDALQLRVDKKTGNRHLGHCVDPKTGLYRGRQVLSVSVKG